MRHMFSYVCLLLLVICCWHCMARHIKDKKPVPDDSSASHEHKSHSREDKSNSHEHKSHSHEDKSHSHEDKSHSHEDKSHSHEHGSHSHEHESSKEKKSTCTDRKKSKGETDIDCGGEKCAKCANSKICLANRDCSSNFCKLNRCAERSTTTTTTTEKPKTKTYSTTTPSTTSTSPKTVTTTVSKTTTTAAPETEEPATAAPETEEPATAAPETEEPATAAPETEEPPTAALEIEETATTSPTCDFNCENGGTCTSNNQCTCASGFSGVTCEVQSVGLCLNNETFETEPLLLITFGSGSERYSTATPASFDFSTTYKQVFKPRTNDGMFSFINSMEQNSNAWHANATDHTGDENGYMYFVNADFKAGQFYRGTVNDLCVGLRYEFSVYLANVCKPSNKIKPNVRFEVRSVVGNTLLAQLESGDIAEHKTLTWEKYGFSFIATSPSVNLLMISNAGGGNGNDIVIDDIALRVCSHKGSGLCPSN